MAVREGGDPRDGEFTAASTWGGRPVARRVADAESRGRVVVTGTVGAVRNVEVAGTTSTACELSDASGTLGLLFVGQRRIRGLTDGVRCTIEGTARLADGRLVVWNPRYRLEPGSSPPRLRPL